MLSDVINTLGGSRVAEACGVTKGCVSIWKRKGHLPRRGGRPDARAAVYERRIAELAEITVEDLRAWIAEPAPRKAA